MKRLKEVMMLLILIVNDRPLGEDRIPCYSKKSKERGLYRLSIAHSQAFSNQIMLCTVTCKTDTTLRRKLLAIYLADSSDFTPESPIISLPLIKPQDRP